MSKRTLKVSYGKSGAGYLNTKLSIPKTILEDMGVSQEEREVELEYNQDKKEIIIRKVK
ncbi:hypothetical protein HMPREF3180_01565 [Leptotrichia wadei]|uniref:SpoVT-AbrB domain-containing protein n=1 Tax=Leptotrichia wadei TaxID=157687 RepID=A0A134A6I1_9FUSO|nr:AbrB/MazE/SpoVT family DNA-binding domain-containing protein [Leptotrichia wadei]KXB63305.1 hypothetical protein HMPREF3180_01565 [Leptotrichia wadei]